MTPQPDRECPECGEDVTEDEWDDMLDMCDSCCATQALWDDDDDLELDDELE